jgi:hypothetical protein
VSGAKLPSWLQGGAWMSDVQVLASGCHFLMSFGPLVVAAYLGASLLVLKCLSGFVILFALVKEFLYDANFEVPHQTFQMNLEDFLGYCAGTAFAWGVVLVKAKWFS